MDFLLIVLAIGGLVVAGVMLVLASRTSRMQRESDARVDRLQARATGSVLFADAFIESADDADEVRAIEARDDAPQPARPLTVDVTTSAYPFVMTVPAGGGRVQVSFDRTPGRRT